jgi:hypothetical protein
MINREGHYVQKDDQPEVPLGLKRAIIHFKKDYQIPV